MAARLRKVLGFAISGGGFAVLLSNLALAYGG